MSFRAAVTKWVAECFALILASGVGRQDRGDTVFINRIW